MAVKGAGTAAGRPVPPPTVLVVEDRLEVRQLVMRALAEQGLDLQVATTGPDAVEAAMGSLPDLIVLDLGLPGCDGLDVIAELRTRGFDRPILVLTARGGVTDRVRGLDAGADDYVAKPFDIDELCARVRALLRRSHSNAPMLRIGELECDSRAREIRRNGRSLALTQREFALLEYLMRHAGRPVSREEIAREVWRTEIAPDNNIIDVYISYLRQKLTSGGAPQLLHTVRRVGYVLEDRSATAAAADTAVGPAAGDRSGATASARTGAKDSPAAGGGEAAGPTHRESRRAAPPSGPAPRRRRE